MAAAAAAAAAALYKARTRSRLIKDPAWLGRFSLQLSRGRLPKIHCAREEMMIAGGGIVCGRESV